MRVLVSQWATLRCSQYDRESTTPTALSRVTLAIASTIILTAILGTTNAVAEEAPFATPAVHTAALVFGGYNAERAAKNGYDVRTDKDGWQYAVPIGTPNGSLEGATSKYNPTTGETRAASIFPQLNTVAGDCGTATLTLYTKTSGYTAYNLNGLLGTALYHTWVISVSASTGNQLVDRSGLPPVPGASLSWGTNFTYGVEAGQGTTVFANVSNGVVETSLGDCSAGHPSDSL